MQKIVSITSQGQLTVPQLMLRSLGVTGPVKAIIRKKANKLEVEVKKDFWSLGGILKSNIKLTDAQLRKTRDEFAQKWSKQ
ncbi:hypothetical protein A3D00_02365 [Candidatus Woesebacteria bacterium RIFCSPHIGHO2_02_FULL_38_9]|uniref:SpoVT-AbrB domain-containing protein n=1 Tax=Candidatus Woesebacteria bacterium RIFCSPHIGHO2_01_FULL_39_28 TaxID=1802496 RepID=A0A1F7YEK4_9BACT|nr:MAG: hypothetical protein A2627_01735 [Candidatus Woesebacteria bacterium RIFCSPHIGHO2_01_FULL_39_28]OGM31636.1 MAG: hypothetical protein A3D00_02365 [Candidatus Woesebacteria bacterium RIFCSPHIGHO2_02_FULL_38_9]OGM56907.1 MAG: hypothetical protein A3A50_04120 [Candidatus Woesebacteria bacterium RIFCSPLOWO2_01_FULL_38_20]